MPAFKGINLRSGDLAEQLGVLLLQSVALVAPIPRTEDVGIDVVATLIKKYDNYRYIAENSFFVQIKSASVTEIAFNENQLRWLNELHLPLFIATVDRKAARIKLYTTHSLSDALVENPERRSIKFKLLNEYEGDYCGKEEDLDLPIGPPVIEWSLEDLETVADFSEKFYELLKAHVTLAKKAIETRRVGFVEMAIWKTGELPRIYGTKQKPIKDFSVSDEVSMPYFQSIINSEDVATSRTLYRILEKILQREGHFQLIDGKRELIPWTNPLADEILKDPKKSD